VKFAGATGAELWSQSPTILDFGLSSATLDQLGDVLLAGSGITSKVNGTDGTEAWRQLQGGSAVAVDHANNVILVKNDGFGTFGYLVKLTSTGEEFPAPEPGLIPAFASGCIALAGLSRHRRAS
jgi:hypothetical protein